MTQPELKSCPFCGADVCEICFDDEDTAPDGGRRARVECSESETCFANTGWQDDLDAAIAAWNTRALTPKQQAAEEMAKALEATADELSGYVGCSDGCTCGDGWGHADPQTVATARAALAAYEKAGQQ